MRFGYIFVGILMIFLLSGMASAEIDSGDTAWVLMSSAMVLLMTPAVGLFYGGMIRKKNVLAILTQSFIVIALISVQWTLVGYSLSFGPDVGGFIGSLEWAGLNGVGMEPSPDYGPSIPHLLFMAFQMMFAIITPALVIGAFADRMKFPSFIAFSLLWATFVYDPICHWVWAVGGWIRDLGALDFAGGNVVHISAGISAILAAIIIGKRVELNNGSSLQPHNITMTLLGGSLLWFGWFGFNAGSALGANGLAAHAFVTTNIAAAAAAISWMSVSWKHTGKPSTLGIVTGAVCGLVGITPAAGFVSPLAAIIIGGLAGALCYIAAHIVKDILKIDDALDVMACHGFGGIIGGVLTGVFAQLAINPDGANGLLAGNPMLVITQMISILAVLAYAAIVTVVLLKIIDATIGLRVNKREEILGLDLTQHGEQAFPDLDIPG